MDADSISTCIDALNVDQPSDLRPMGRFQRGVVRMLRIIRFDPKPSGRKEAIR